MANSAAVDTSTRLRPSSVSRSRTPRGLLLQLSVRLRRPWLDGQIAGAVERPGDRALALREAQLVGPRERRRLARRLEQVLAARPRPSGLSSAVPIDHRAVEVAGPLLNELILALRSSEEVEARGVLLAWRLLTEAGSPVYTPPDGRPGDPDRLWYEALAVLFALRPLPAGNGAEAARR